MSSVFPDVRLSFPTVRQVGYQSPARLRRFALLGDDEGLLGKPSLDLVSERSVVLCNCGSHSRLTSLP